MTESQETGISHTKGGSLYVSSSETAMINRLRQIAEEHPDEVKILAKPEDNYGCIYLRMPFSYLKINPPRQLNLSEEDRLARAERIREWQNKKRTQNS